MSRPHLLKRFAPSLGLLMGCTLLALPLGRAAETPLSDVPLVNATTIDILPNIFFVLDDSGSMDWNYMPDYVPSSYCRGSGTALTTCSAGDPPYYLSTFNRVYYNPMVNYTPPKNADGSDKTNYTTWTSVPMDGYKIQDNANVNLVTGYREEVACKNSYDDPWGNNCKVMIENGSYAYPNSTYSNIVVRYGGPVYYTGTVEWCSTQESSGPRFGKAGTCQSQKTSTYRYVRYSNWTRTAVISSVNSYLGPNGTTRTYAQEMTNFANWHAWYRTRMQMMKTAVGQTFADIRGTPNSSDVSDKNYFHARVGFTTINYTSVADSTRYLDIKNFDQNQKNTWFSRLYATLPSGGTPLLQSLTKVGDIYAGKKGADPIQYSCQRNFTILSTDGYWSDNSGISVGDQDGKASRPAKDDLKKSNTLADVAYYYYNTDLRSTMANNVPPAGSKQDEDDIASHQHMTTFTIGLGVDGTLAYQDGYRTATSGAYYDIKQGTKSWPDPISYTAEERIDDLWHAAVNGRGTYFSARNPESLVKGLSSALGAMESASGSGAAAATSALKPVTGDNYIYIANYTTVTWEGQLSSYMLDLSTGAIASSPVWKASSPLDQKIGAAGNADSRTIYTGSTALVPFLWDNLSATQKTYFDNTKLSQYQDWSDADKTTATGPLLINYLRGHHRFEDQDRDTAFGAYNRLYRDRATVLGDIVHSQPVYVQKPNLEFIDAGYAEYAAAQAGRASTVYIGANDGMLHAFNGNSGSERWAFVPPMSMKNMWRLADKDYTTNHRFLVDGPLIVTDAMIGGAWKTVLVGALGKGGRGYYALDITVPDAPSLLWTFSADQNPNMGYSYGAATITKVNGKWVALLPSGYNNVPESGSYISADGGGYLFMVDVASGALLQTFATGIGSPSNPSGLAYVNTRVDDIIKDNTSIAAYGGDLMGNMWRFDLSKGTVSQVMALGPSQPITTAAEMGLVNDYVVLFFGTGRYLDKTDLDNTAPQTLYAVKADNGLASRGNMTQKAINGVGIDASSVNWNTQDGWYLDLPVAKERSNLPPQLFYGTIAFATIIPEASACQPGGSSRMYFLDYKTGGGVDDGQAVFTFTSAIVGFTVIELPGGTKKLYPIRADGALPIPINMPISTGTSSNSKSGHRMMWRELAN